MIEFYRKYWRTGFDIAMIVLTVYLIMWTFSFIYQIAAPILLAFIVFWVIEPLARLFHRWGLGKSLATALSVLFYAIILLGLLAVAGYIFVTQTTGLIEKIPHYEDSLKDHIEANFTYLKDKWEALPPDIGEKVKGYASDLAGFAADAAQGILKGLVGFIGSFSTFLINFAIAVILAFFLSVEIDSWKRIAHDKTPNTFKKAFHFLRENVIKGITAYLKAQFKLISVTFIVVLVALLILGVKNAFAVSLLAAFFDILPLLGVSTLFIPWIIYLFFVGSSTLAIWLSALLAVIIVVRQILEPKITGDTLGVSAFTMLSFMIISLSIFGVSGLILSPVLIILLKALSDQGYLKKWIRLPEDYD